MASSMEVEIIILWANPDSVIPLENGIQVRGWTPVFTGVTISG